MGRDTHVLEFASGAAGFEGRNTRSIYDLAGRPLWRDVSDQGVSWSDALLRDERIYGYDGAGRVSTETWQPEGAAAGTPTLSTGYGYDQAGNRTSIVWPKAT